MIYCVVPPELEGELYAKLVDYYSDNPTVTVIVDRRDGPNRRQGEPPAEAKQRRAMRDRRRARAPGTFPSVEPPLD